ncbi:transmembrane reductase CYB561D2 isoform X2 [Trichomycterus rosablanca]
MTLAFSFLMSEAILLFSPHSSPVSKLKHQTKSRLHWVLQASCACCAVVGLGAIFYNKRLNGKPHFSTWHGSIGVVAVFGVAVQSVGALPLLYHKLAKGWSLAKLKRYHAASGLVVYLMGSASLLLGACSAWYTGIVGGYAWYLTALCPTIAALVIMSQVTDAYMAKKRLQS